jgi:hypothetical protein
MTDEPQRKRQARSPSVGRDNNWRWNTNILAVAARDDDAAHARNGALGLDERAARQDTEFDANAARKCAAEQHLVEVAATDGEAAPAAAIPRPDSRAVLAGDDHSVDRLGASVNLREGEAPQQSQRARVERVAAQLVARKPRAIDKQHPGAAAREHGCRDAARGSRAADDDIEHLYAGNSASCVVVKLASGPIVRRGRARWRCSWTRIPGSCTARRRSPSNARRWE